MIAKYSFRPVKSIAKHLTMLGLLVVMSGLFPAQSSAHPAAQSSDDMAKLASLSGADFEMEFLNMMIMHHMSAVEMAKHEVERGAHPELKALAQQINDDQTREINEMSGWLQSWYNMMPQHDMGMMNDMTMMQNMASLNGDALDKEFLVQMRTHHMSAVEMAGLVPTRATHAELKTLAQNIISSQTAEIKQFESWLMSWYNAEPSGATMPGMGGMPAAQASPTAQPAMPATGAGDQFALMLTVMLLAMALLVSGVWLSRRTRRRA